MKYDTVIFDLDGTLLDTLDDLMDSVNYCMEKYGLKTHTREEIRSFVGNGIRKLIERSVPGGLSHPQYEEIYQEMAVYYREHSQVKTKAYDGILDMLKCLHERGVKMAIVSNKNDDAAKKLASLYFADYIEVVIGATERMEKKPAPDTVYEALKKLGKDQRKALFVGDSEVDSMTAKNAGMDCVLVTWGFRSKEELSGYPAKAVIDAADELIELTS